MTDYLWDKSGEPEEDVARLEQLLGTLRYEPRPFVVPEEFEARGPRRPFRPQQRPLRWQRLAVAASLLLTLLAGAWLLKSQHNKQAQSATTQGQQLVPPTKEQTPQNVTATVNNANEQPTPKQKDTARSERVNYRRPQRVLHRDGAIRHAPRELINRPQQQLAGRQSPRASSEEPMTPEQKRAAEQLLLALRIASAKLNYAQREMQEASAAHKPETR